MDGLKIAKYSNFSPDDQYGYQNQDIETLYPKNKYFDSLSSEKFEKTLVKMKNKVSERSTTKWLVVSKASKA